MSEEEASILFPSDMVKLVREKYAKVDSLKKRKENIIKVANEYTKISDEELWGLIIEPNLLRSWMVWSNGYCPKCKKEVPMYDWVIDANNNPWKVSCPHCKDIFPKNDFLSYYKSGLGEDSRFSYKKADDSLLFNEEHPEPNDPLHTFGVDNGKGYTNDGDIWYFIPHYIVKGNWSKTLGIIGILSEAYMLTGVKLYAHKCGIVLDRLADLYGEYDYNEQGLVYEKFHNCTGYISYRINAAGENATLPIAFDKIIEGIKGDKELVSFLHEKAKKCGFINKKESAKDIIDNIKTGLIKDIIENKHKYLCNYPYTDVAALINNLILAWPNNREDIIKETVRIIDTSTKVDGLSGESGMEDYARLTKGAINTLLETLGLIENGTFIKEIIDKSSNLLDMYAFHVDTFCLNRYYPKVGDGGKLGVPYGNYAGYSFDKYMLWKVYKKTMDTKYVKAMYLLNNKKIKGMFDSILTCFDNVDDIYDEIDRIIKKEGYQINQPSIIKENWGIGILRSGKNENRIAPWLFFGKHTEHEHLDNMTIGLFAKGMELIAEIGYPEIEFGGWHTVNSEWAKHAFAHNKVITNRLQAVSEPDSVTLFVKGNNIKAIRAQNKVNDICNQLERTLVLIDINDKDSYVLDVSRINTTLGNYEIFIRGTVGNVLVEGVQLQEKDLEFTEDIFLKNFKGQENANTGWNMDLAVEDFFGVFDPESKFSGHDVITLKEKSNQWIEKDIHLKFTSLTKDADVYIGESLAIHYLDNGKMKELWIPIAIERKMGFENKTGTFAGIYEPYEDNSNIQNISRLPLRYSNGEYSKDLNVGANIKLVDGREDLIITFDIADKEINKKLIQADWKVETDCELCVIRKDKKGSIIYIAACKGTYIIVEGKKNIFKASQEIEEIFF